MKSFHDMYKTWEESGYNRLFSPSIDRIDDSETYSFDNIRLVTFKENNTAWFDKVRSCNAENSGMFNRRPVIQYDLDMQYINEYRSVSEASRASGIETGNISYCCKGKVRRTKKFIWRYKEQL